MNINNNISSLAFKYRGLFWGLFAAGILIFPGSFGSVRFFCGAIVLVLGQILRFYAAGFIPEYRTVSIGAPVLVTWGPYKWVRNPLYAGNFLMGAGWALMVSWGWLVAFCFAFLLLYCVFIIPAEEDFLAKKYKEAYSSYKKQVPALFPFPRNGYPEESCFERPFDAKEAWCNEIYSLRVNVLLTAIITIRLYFTLEESTLSLF